MSVLTFGLVGGDKVSESDARSAVNQIYLELLGRELESGPSAYVDCLTQGHCAFAGGHVDPENRVDAIRTHVLQSPEYRARAERVITQTFDDLRTTQATGGMPPQAFAGAGGIPSSVAGIPIVYLVGGVAALMLLKKRR